jgi:hypothetical protein
MRSHAKSFIRAFSAAQKKSSFYCFRQSQFDEGKDRDYEIT